ncbi:MAG TPA: hypothetical protein VMU82_19090, partial [Acetobacteraceae bacterium]|nr:hypothetical protein [Acetobacteraceae bacterium]
MTIRSGLWFLLLAATACHSFAAFAAGTEIMQADVSTSAQISIGPTAISDSRAGVRSLARNNFAVASIQKDKNSTQRSQSFSNSLVSKKIGNVTLHIPQGYIDPMNGYPDYINIHALLPCLLP